MGIIYQILVSYLQILLILLMVAGNEDSLDVTEFISIFFFTSSFFY